MRKPIQLITFVQVYILLLGRTYNLDETLGGFLPLPLYFKDASSPALQKLDEQIHIAKPKSLLRSV